MSFFISNAMADTAEVAAGSGQGLGSLLFLGVFFLIFYFLFIRPQTKKAKEHRNMLQKLEKGDEVVTSGGILGKITQVADSFFTVEVAQGIEIKVQKPAIAACLPKGTINSTN